MIQLPEKEASLWRDSYTGLVYPELTEDIEVDIAIVGGGITGLTAGYLLSKAGKSVAVLEKRTIGAGTSGRTTGKISSQHNIVYSDFYKRLGEERTRDYAQANQSAVQQVADIIAAEKIECSWQVDDNYIYTTDPAQVQTLKDEAAVAAELGLPSTFETKTPLPFDALGAVKFTNQGKFNAQQYVLGLAAAIKKNGGDIFENSNVTGIRDGSPGRVRTRRASVTAQSIIVATAVPTLPLLARGAYCALEYPTESYIVAGPLPKKLTGMYISPDDSNHSILPIMNDGQQMLLVGGNSHLSGFRGNTTKKYQDLANYAEKHLGLKEITHRWSDRDYLTYDGIPLAGKAYPWSKNLYVGTAYRKWGLSNGTAAGMIISDLILGKPNPWAHTYRPTRFSPVANIPRVALKYITRQN